MPPLLIAVALGILLNPLNSSMISVALVRMQEDFGLTFADSTWLISSYYLASAIGQPVMGKLSDTLGRRRLFLIGLGLVATASALAPLAPNFGTLIAFRTIQAIGSSTLYPAGMGAVRKAITERQARALGVLSMFASTSAAFGPSIGGFLIHFGDWPAIFLINFPFIAASAILAFKAFPKDGKRSGAAARPDIVGILLFACTIVCLLVFLLSLKTAPNWWVLGGGAAALAAFIRCETRRADPFIDVRALSRNINVSLVYVQFVLVNVLFYSLFFGIPQYLQHALGYGADATGLMMLSIAGFGVLVSPAAGRWIDRTRSSRGVLLAGSAAAVAGTLLLWGFGGTASPVALFLILALLGCSNGFNNLGLQTALYAFVSQEETGAASGLFMTSRYLGTILSSSLLGLVFGSQVTAPQLRIMAVVGAGLGLLLVLLTLRMPRRDRTAHAGS